jgi:ribosomal subunit interface protein
LTGFCINNSNAIHHLGQETTMKIQITHPDAATTPRLKEYIEQRLGLALGRFADRIGVVHVKFADAKLGPSVEVTRCRIDVGLRKTVVVEAADRDLFAAVDRAVEIAVRRLALAIDLDDTNVGPLRTVK